MTPTTAAGRALEAALFSAYGHGLIRFVRDADESLVAAFIANYLAAEGWSLRWNGVSDEQLAEAFEAVRAAPLDVERLARALHDYSGWYTDHNGPVCLACTEDAADIAREYATEVQP